MKHKRGCEVTSHWMIKLKIHSQFKFDWKVYLMMQKKINDLFLSTIDVDKCWWKINVPSLSTTTLLPNSFKFSLCVLKLKCKYIRVCRPRCRSKNKCTHLNEYNGDNSNILPSLLWQAVSYACTKEDHTSIE